MANFARNDVLYGARGYRRTLVEAGRVIERVLQKAALLKIEAKVWLGFTDHHVDAVLEADGVEVGVLAVIELG